MGEVEAQPVGSNQRTLLLHVRAQHLAEGEVNQVGGGMVVLRGLPQVFIDHSSKSGGQVLRQSSRNMHPQVVLLNGIINFDFLIDVLQDTAVTQLSARFSIEGSLVEDNLEQTLAFCFYLSVFQNLAFTRKGVITHKFCRMDFVGKFHPVFGFHGGGGT